MAPSLNLPLAGALPCAPRAALPAFGRLRAATADPKARPSRRACSKDEYGESETSSLAERATRLDLWGIRTPKDSTAAEPRRASHPRLRKMAS